MLEMDILKRIQVAVSAIGSRLFRNNVAMAWASSHMLKVKSKGMYPCSHGDVILRQARPIHAGLIKGASDLIGWTPVTITEDMVGKTVAVFTACEVKTGLKKATNDQQVFIDNVNGAGGCAFVAHSAEEAEEGIQGWATR